MRHWEQAVQTPQGSCCHSWREVCEKRRDLWEYANRYRITIGGSSRNTVVATAAQCLRVYGIGFAVQAGSAAICVKIAAETGSPQDVKNGPRFFPTFCEKRRTH
jgi:hypothetical protein